MVLGALVVVAAASHARATTILRVPVEDLSRSAAVVIQGRVEDVRVVADPADERRISTKVTVAVGRVLKGHASGPRLTITLAGGRLGLWNATIPGTPTFEAGEEVVLFLEATSDGLKPSGLVEGKYRVTRDAAGRARATRSLEGVAVLSRTPKGGLAAEGEVSHPDDDLDLDELVRRIGAGAGGAR
jgi:hypothetical protein